VASANSFQCCESFAILPGSAVCVLSSSSGISAAGLGAVFPSVSGSFS